MVGQTALGAAMRSLFEIFVGAVLLICCLMIRWPTGELDPQRDAEAWLRLEDAKDADPTMTARWEKMAENRARLLVRSAALGVAPSVTKASGHSTEVAQATLTWSDRVMFASNDQGELLIGRGSQIWSRGPVQWRAGLVRDGWEIESAKWVQVHEAGVWELHWRRSGGGESPQGLGETAMERRDRSLRKL